MHQEVFINGAQWQRKGSWYILEPLLYLCYSIQLQKAKSLSLIPSYKYSKISIHYAKNCEFVNKILFKMLRIKIFRNNVLSCFVQNSSYTLIYITSDRKCLTILLSLLRYIVTIEKLHLKLCIKSSSNNHTAQAFSSLKSKIVVWNKI